MFYVAWNEQKMNSCKPKEDMERFKRVQDYFTCNLDESCFVASDGCLRVLGKHNEQLPICQTLVDKGLDHIMTKTLKVKIDILKYVFGHKEAKNHCDKTETHFIFYFRVFSIEETQ